MTWLQRYRVRHYVQNSIWIYPVLAIVAAMLLVRALHSLEQEMGWEADVHPDTMRAVLGTLAGAMFTFVVFVCSSLLLVVQLASAQLSPRMIAVLMRDPVTKLTLSMFVFTFAFAISALVRVGDTVPLLTGDIAAYSSAACLGFFLFLIDRVSKLLRPSGALRSVALQAHPVIESVYPRRMHGSQEKLPGSAAVLTREVSRVVTSQIEGVVLAFDRQGLVTLAARHDCVIELVPQVGNFVAPGSALFRVFGSPGVPDDLLRQSIAVGAERTMEQDPAFAFRVIVDIASKALSPAINDPTTAVLALDRIHHLLRHVGNRCLDNEQIRDTTGRVRLIYYTPDWEDFVGLAVTEIRHFGGSSIQVARRLRAMLADLLQILPVERLAPLRHELAMLQRSAHRFFPEPEDQALAAESDSQGMGGQSPTEQQPTEAPSP